MNYDVRCENGVCTAKLAVSMYRAYEISPERQAPWVRERVSKSPHGQYLGYGLNLKTQQVDAGSRTVLFIASTESEDRYGDVIVQAGWKLDNYRQNPVVLFAHDSESMPIGRAERFGVDRDLFVLVKFATHEQYAFADSCFRMVEGGFLRGISVGFIPLEFEFMDGTAPGPVPGLMMQGRRYTKQELVENSIVPVPANPGALAVSRGFENAIRAIEIAGDAVPDFRAEETGSVKIDRHYFVVDPVEQVDICFGEKNPSDAPTGIDRRYAAVSFNSNGTVRAASLRNAKTRCDARRIAGKILADNPLIDGVTLGAAVGTCASNTVFETFDQIERADRGDVESVLFDKKKWALAKARAWCREHHFKADQLEPSPDFYRFRQFDPGECVKGSYETLTQKMPDGIELIVCHRKKENAAMNLEERSVVPFHHYPLAPRKATWDADAEMGSTKNPIDWYKMCTIVTGDKKLKGSYHLPHHKGPGGKFATVLRGVGNALARLDQTHASDADRSGARSHLMRHRAEFGEKGFDVIAFDAGLVDLEVLRDSVTCPEEKELLRRAISEWVVTLDWRVKAIAESLEQPFANRKDVLTRLARAVSEEQSGLVPQHWSNEDTTDNDVADGEKPKSPSKLERAREVAGAAKQEVSRTLAVARSYMRELDERLTDIAGHVRMMPGGGPYDQITDRAGGDSDGDDVDVRGFGVGKIDEPTYTGEQDADNVKPAGSGSRKPHLSSDEDARVGVSASEDAKGSGEAPFSENDESSRTGGEDFHSSEKPHSGQDETSRVGGEGTEPSADVFGGQDETAETGSGEPGASRPVHSGADEDARVGLSNKVSAARSVAKAGRKAVIRAHERLRSYLGELSDDLGGMSDSDLEEKPAEKPRKPYSGSDEDAHTFGGPPAGQDAKPAASDGGDAPSPYPFPLKSEGDLATALLSELETKSGSEASNEVTGTGSQATAPNPVSTAESEISALARALEDAS